MVVPQNALNQKTSCSSSDLTQASETKFKVTKISSLKLFHQNVRGLQHKVDEWTCMLASHDLSPNVICLTEHYLTEQKLSLIKLESYDLTSHYSRSVNSGGGVSIYCKQGMDCNPIDITEYCMEKEIEACAARLSIDNNLFIILCIYR
jgi:hypothetical protein